VNPLPEAAVALGIDDDDPGKRVRRSRDVLVFAELPETTRNRLRERGARLVDADSVLGAVALLADRGFDAAILEMTLSAEIVKRIKADLGSVEGVPDELCAAARGRHRLTPFFLVMAGQPQYAIVVDPPEHSYVESGSGISLIDAVMTLEVSKLVMRGAALA
jgi:hypothetical protein